jgi:hypothetical protein
MADDKLSKPEGILPGEPPSKPVPGISQDAIYSGTPKPAAQLPKTRSHSTSWYAKIIWAIVAGAVFTLVRFLVVFPIAVPHDTDDGLQRDIRRLPWIAAPSAGLSGALLWWLIVGGQSSRKRGAIVGLLAALFSYVGIGLFGGDPGYGVIGLGVTGWIVFPALAGVGVLLSSVQ